MPIFQYYLIDMNTEQNSKISFQSAAQYVQNTTIDNVPLNQTSTKGRTTAAIIPSSVAPGVDIVVYERVDLS